MADSSKNPEVTARQRVRAATPKAMPKIDTHVETEKNFSRRLERRNLFAIHFSRNMSKITSGFWKLERSKQND